MKQEDLKTMNDQQTPINTFDLSLFDELDPILAEGHKVSMAREVELELKKSGIIITRMMRIRVLFLGDEQLPSNIRIEITSEFDLFFYGLCEIDFSYFKKIQESQRLKCNFSDFLVTIRKLIVTACDGEDPNDKYRISLKYKEDNSFIEFIRVMLHKEVVVLSLKCVSVTEEFLKKVISFRFNLTKSMAYLYTERITSVTEMLKARNPQLYTQVAKIPSQLTSDFIKSVKREKELESLSQTLLGTNTTQSIVK